MVTEYITYSIPTNGGEWATVCWCATEVVGNDGKFYILPLFCTTKGGVFCIMFHSCFPCNNNSVK